MNNDQTHQTTKHRDHSDFKSEIAKWFLFFFVLTTATFSHAQTFSTNRTPVGLEHNILFHSDQRSTTTQSGSQAFHLNALFDGAFAVCYTPSAVDPADPVVINIEELPDKHIQQGAWVGWSTRARPAKHFKIEGYNVYQGSNTWEVFADYETVIYPNSGSYMIKIPIAGSYTKLRFTFYEAHHSTGRIGLSELFFIHPEATTPYGGLFDNSSGGTSVWDLNNGNATFQGNVGIGTTTPGTPLHIAQSDPAGLRFTRSNHDSYEFYLSGSNGLNIRNQTDGRDEMVFLGNGNIGIGTSNPDELFTINQGSGASGLSLQRDGYDDYNLILQGGKGLNIRNNADGRNEMVFDGNGKVGIGTDSPAKELEVAGDLVVGRNGQSGKIHFRRSLDGTMRGFVGFTSGDNYQDIKICNETGGGWLTFLTNDGSNTQERMRVAANGNVGIGTSAPDQKLSVNGKINAEEIILEDVAGADFVFEEDYDLRSLAETEQFIKANKHLPEIPSAAEMAEEGLEIKVMNIRLLQKIEELTLHMIRMEKEAKAMQQTTADLASKVLQQEQEIQELKATSNN